MAARALNEGGLDVTLFDKGRRPGGRANTRTHGKYQFDHGAQFFTVRSSLIQDHLGSWLAEGVVAPWSGTLVRIEGDEVAPATSVTRYVGVPGMIGLAQSLSRGLKIQSGCRIGAVERVEDLWSLTDSEGTRLGPFDFVVVAVPAPQAAPLLAHSRKLKAAASRVEMLPCWAGMLVFSSALAVSFDGAFLADGTLSWIAKDSSKPGRPPIESWVMHASTEWTLANLELDPSQALSAMQEALAIRFGPLPDPLFGRAHRWGYALAKEHPPVGCLYDGDSGIGACGDWCEEGRVEGALLSGVAMAKKILAQTSTESGRR